MNLDCVITLSKRRVIVKTIVDIRGATSENMPVKTNMIIDMIVLITKTAQSPIMLSVRDI